jgi:hypothetical protein
MLEAAGICGLSLRQLQREIAAGRGPIVTHLSSRRVAIAHRDLTNWLRARRRRIERRTNKAA